MHDKMNNISFYNFPEGQVFRSTDLGVWHVVFRLSKKDCPEIYRDDAARLFALRARLDLMACSGERMSREDDKDVSHLLRNQEGEPVSEDNRIVPYKKQEDKDDDNRWLNFEWNHLAPWSILHPGRYYFRVAILDRYWRRGELKTETVCSDETAVFECKQLP